MKYHRAVLPPRIDLRSRRKRVAARVMVRGLDLAERLMSRMLVEVTPLADDPFCRVFARLTNDPRLARLASADGDHRCGEPRGEGARS